MEQTPRHVFISAETSATVTGLVAQEADVDTWLDQVYSDLTIVVQRRAHPSQAIDGVGAALPTSSSTMPSLMIEMLEALDLHDGHRVLEIGTGTGYNAALLSHRLGSERVVSIDIDPDLVGVARRRLKELGHSPILVAGNGLDGVPEHGPYDRIIATCAVPQVPEEWIKQLAPGGAMLINVRGEIAGVLCLLSRQDEDDEVIGSVVRSDGNFMWLRRELNNPLRDEESSTVIGARKVARRLTTLSPTDFLEDKNFLWLLQLELPGLRMICSTEVFDPMDKVSRPGILMHAEDGSHAQVINEPETDGQHRVIQGGCCRLWDTVETAYKRWVRLGNPDPCRFKVVANSTIQFVSLDGDTNWLRWPLPLV
ncbi:MAG TPA: methyltransferase domain-containing protein [Pseudonocardiaceae bacterium]|nr:methyltransferase domain-containing protein [Pseudonocardiaceae bacterium]